MTHEALELNRGSNLDLTTTLDENGVLINMTGWVVAWSDIQPPVLAGDLTIEITNPAAGEVSLTLPWSDLWPKGSNAQIRIRWRLSGLPEAIPELIVVLQ
ncbi:MAG: hypothetical protein ACOH2H_15425 [Cypionkella sp.]